MIDIMNNNNKSNKKKHIPSILNKKIYPVLLSSCLLFSCGGSGSDNSTSGPKTTLSVTITGLVTDRIIANADVKIRIGDEEFITNADNQGSYSTKIEVDEALSNNLVQIVALGDANLNAEVEFVSQLGSIGSIVNQAGDDAILDITDNFAVNITNVTTAEFALITRDGNTPTTDTELNTAQATVDDNDKNTLAAIIKIVVDNDDYNLPQGVTSTLDLVDDINTAEAFIQEVTTQDPNLISNTIDEIANDSNLTNSQSPLVGTWKVDSAIVAFTQSGHYIHIENINDDCGQLGYELGTYNWNETTGDLQLNTKEDTNGCSGLHDNDEPLNILRKAGLKLVVTGDTLVATEQDTNDKFTLQRIMSNTDPKVGGFLEGNLNDEFFFIALIEGGVFVELAHDNDETGVTIGLYTWDLGTKTLDFTNIVITQIGFSPYQNSANLYGDIAIWRDGDESGVMKRIRTTTDQPYLTTNNILGNFSGVRTDTAETFTITFNSNGTAEVLDTFGSEPFTWELIFGQLKLVQSNEDYIGIFSPTAISAGSISFSALDYEFDEINTSFFTETWTRQ